MDTLAYSGNVALLQYGDPVRAHEAVYSHVLPPHLLGTDSQTVQSKILKKRAEDPYYATLYFPFFSIKPLYILSLEAMHAVGIDIFTSIRLVSILCYVGIGLTAWLYTRSLFALLVMALPEIIALGEASEPDALSVFFLLVGLWLVFVKRRDWGIVTILAAIWIRPENVILALATIAAMFLNKRLTLKHILVLCALAVVSTSAISHYGHGWTALYSHTFLGSEPDHLLHFSFRDYQSALVSGLGQLAHRPSALLFWLLWMGAFRYSTDAGFKTIAVLLGFFFAVRFLLFPSYETRFFGAFFAFTAISTVSIIRTEFTFKAALPSADPARLQEMAA